jgi:quinol monooxygenase YgiN
MIRRIAEYTIREGELDTITAAIRRFVDAVRAYEPETRYDAYRRADTSTFIHFMAFPTEGLMRRHQQAAYTATFVEVLYPRCSEPPRFTDLEAVEPS